MSRLRRITIEDFKQLLQAAQEAHEENDEPIPQLKDGQLDTIDSSLKTPFQTFDKQDLYKGFLNKAAILFYLINKNHGLSNGNKRMACLTLGYFFFLNNRPLIIPEDVFYGLAKTVTESEASQKDEVLKFIKESLQPYI